MGFGGPVGFAKLEVGDVVLHLGSQGFKLLISNFIGLGKVL